MNKLLILEKEVAERMPGYDHIFSYVSNPADSFPEDYLTRDEAKVIYRELITCIYNYLEEIETKENLIYRGVPLLTCFQKEPFQDLYFIALRLAILDRVLDARKPSACDILPKPAATFGSSLSIALDEATRRDLHICFLEHERSKPGFPKGRSWSWPCFPFKLATGNLAECKTLIFSDYKKSIDVLKELDPSKTILFQNHFAVKTLFRAFKHKISLYQFFSQNSTKVHDELMQKISRVLESLEHTGKLTVGAHNLELFFRQSLRKLVESRIPTLLSEIDAMHEFLSKAKQLKTAFLDEDITSSKKAFCYIARQYGVGTFVETHGVLADMHGYAPLTADRIFVWGEAQKGKLMDWGVPEKRIIVSGCSWHDRYKKLNARKLRARISRKLGIRRRARIVLVGFPAINGWRLYFENQRKNYIKKSMGILLEMLEKRPLHMIIKIRPGDANRNYYYEAIRDVPCADQITLLEHYNSLYLMLISDFVISFDSTFSVEGFSLDKNVLNLYDSLENLYSEFRPYDIFYNAESPEELRVKLDELIQNPSKRRDGWELARKECLNEAAAFSPAQIIARNLSSEHLPQAR